MRGFGPRYSGAGAPIVAGRRPFTFSVSAALGVPLPGGLVVDATTGAFALDTESAREVGAQPMELRVVGTEGEARQSFAVLVECPGAEPPEGRCGCGPGETPACSPGPGRCGAPRGSPSGLNWAAPPRALSLPFDSRNRPRGSVRTARVTKAREVLPRSRRAWPKRQVERSKRDAFRSSLAIEGVHHASSRIADCICMGWSPVRGVWCRRARPMPRASGRAKPCASRAGGSRP